MNNDELQELVTRWSLGLLSDDEAARLDAALVDSADARRVFRRQAVLDELLSSPEPKLLAAWRDGETVRSAETSKHVRRLRGAVAIAAAMLLLATAAVAVSSLRKSAPTMAEQSVQAACAVLAQSLDAKWETPTKSLATGTELVAETVHLTSGMARLEFYCGASVTLEGDARLELHSPWEARLVHGNVRVQVPPAARGFTLRTAQGKVVDLGTEYGLQVPLDRASAELHVFAGEVELHREGSPLQSLREGEAVLADQSKVTALAATASNRFPDSRRLDALRQRHDDSRLAAWSADSAANRRDPRLVAYFPFQRSAGDWTRSLLNRAEPENTSLHGGIVGAAWSTGRWPGKDALEFKRPGDRVRLLIPGDYQSLTVACWAKIDSLDRKYNALLLTDGYDHGEIHWQIYEDGRLMFSIQTGADPPGQKHNEIVYSQPFYSNARSGQWFHLAFSYDNATGEVCQYVNGAPVGCEIAPDHRPARAVVFGASEIGNWGLPTPGHLHPIRNLNGRLDELAIWRAVLGPDEIARLYAQGKPE